ncbi:TolC family protein [Terrimonas sp.]|uniref:TolC family protein n=1 Tax=Terrimonas sp. TaxID=1914338 RepID=UPI0014032465|nr:TolC family protein [Terrimonas sp.]
MSGKRIFSFIIVFVFCTGVARSQQMITLEEAIAATLKNNYDILLAENDSAAAAIDKKYIFGGFLPTVNGTLGRTQTTSAQKQEFDGRPEVEGKGIRARNLSAAINLNLVLFDGLKMFATRDRINELFALGQINLKNQVINSTAAVINAYYIIVRQKQQLKAIDEQMSINEERVKLADRKLSVGLGTKPELLQAKVDLNAQKATRLQQQSIMAQSKEQLNQLTGMQLPESFEVSDSIPIKDDMTIENIQNNIQSTSPAILLALKNVDISRIMLKEVKATRWPIISFGSAYNFTQNNNYNNINPYAAIFSSNKGFNFGFTASVPILNYMNVNRNIKQAQLDVTYQEIALKQQKNAVDVLVKAGFYNYQYQVSLLKLEEENIQLAKENVSIALERFKLGVSTFLELREAQKSLEDAYDRLIAARYNTKLSETELLRLKGELVK